jgi:transposase
MIARRRSASTDLSPVAGPLCIGVDVSKDWLDIADNAGRALRIANTGAAIAEALSGPWAQSCRAMVCEATGGYERPLMKVAAELGLPLRRVHPNRARAFAQAAARLAKTDAIDARMLARFAAFLVDEPATPLPAPQTQTLAALVSRLDQLSDLRQSESCRAQQADEACVKASIAAVIEILDSQIDALQRAIDALITSDPVLTEKASLLRSCKGVGPKSAQMILARLPEIGALDRRKIAALVGVAPITCKSGSSINHASIAGGRKSLRDTLFMAALSASSHNPTFIAFRDRLKANGKPHKLIIVAVIRKLIVTLNAMVKAKTPFKPALT